MKTNKIMETAKEKFLKEVEGILNDNGLEELMDEIIDDDISDVLWNVEDLKGESRYYQSAYSKLKEAERSYYNEVNNINK